MARYDNSNSNSKNERPIAAWMNVAVKDKAGATHAIRSARIPLYADTPLHKMFIEADEGKEFNIIGTVVINNSDKAAKDLEGVEF